MLNSDCRGGLVCVFATCSVACRLDADCKTGFRCLDSALGAACVEATASTCTRTCPTGTTCVEGLCRTPCVVAVPREAGSTVDASDPDAARAPALPAQDASKACRPDQSCVKGGCVGSHEGTGDGGTVTPVPDSGPLAECSAPAKKCDGKIPQSCGTDHQWQNGVACDHVCSAGACIGICDPGTKQCGLTGLPQTCNLAGQWEDGAACAILCSGGSCSGTCTPNISKRCNGNTPQTCDAAGNWVSGTPCDPAASQCDPITYTCKKFEGQVCTAKTDCASNFCRDGYCCDSACSGTCQSCALAGFKGACTNVINAVDADSCAGTNTCSGTGACKYADGQPCVTGSDCANNNCNTFYPDADKDGFGSASSSQRLCTKTAPAGYVLSNNDCCDSDAATYPAEATGGPQGNGTYSTPNKCGSYDYDCSGSSVPTATACNATCSNAYCYDGPHCGNGNTLMTTNGSGTGCSLYDNNLTLYCK